MNNTINNLNLLLLSDDPVNIRLGMQLLRNHAEAYEQYYFEKEYNKNPNNFDEDEVPEPPVLPELPKPEEFANTLLCLHLFHLPILDLQYEWELTSGIKHLFEKTTTYTLESITTPVGTFLDFIGSWGHYGGRTDCWDEQFIVYLDHLAQNIKEVPHTNIIRFTKLMMLSGVSYKLEGYDISVGKIGKMYFCNHASEAQVLAVLRKDNSAHTLKYTDDYLLKLPDYFSKLDLHAMDFTDTTFKEFPDNFQLFPQLKTLCLYGTRASKDYAPENVPEDAFVCLDKLPDSMANLHELTHLDLRRTQLGTAENPALFPDWLAELKQLKTLYLPFGHWQNLPEILVELPRLKQLFIPLIAVGSKKNWGIRYYSNNSYISLTPTLFKYLLPDGEIQVYQETIYTSHSIWHIDEETNKPAY